MTRPCRSLVVVRSISWTISSMVVASDSTAPDWLSVGAGAARKAALSRLESECEAAGNLSCESVSLYHGGLYFLYKYRRYDDVRLVFAPELPIAAFGGDPDNFNFPRWSLDMTMLRVYQNDEPLATPDFLQWRSDGLKPGELMFIAGRPGSTQRLLTVADLKFLRDVTIPQWLIRAAELRGRYIKFAMSGDEANRIVDEWASKLTDDERAELYQEVADAVVSVDHRSIGEVTRAVLRCCA